MDESKITDPAALGRLVRQRRKALGFTQTRIADFAQTTPRFVSELEGGKRTAQIEVVLRVLGALGIELVARTR